MSEDNALESAIAEIRQYREAKKAMTTTKTVITPRLMQLYALRSQLEALIVSEEIEMAAMTDPSACPQCGAPEDKIIDASTMGSKRKKCINCGGEWAG